MPGLKISQLSSSLAPSLTGVTPVVLSGTTYKTTLQSLRNVLVDSGSHVFTGDQTIRGSLVVSGSLTAHQYIVSSSITNVIIQNVSGSSIFGNDLSDRHQFTGSVLVTGSVHSTNIVAKEFLFVSGFAVIGDSIHHSGSDPEALHVGTTDSYNIAHFKGDNDYYSQVYISNLNSGSNASTDLVLVADNGTENVHFIDLGINSSTYTGGLVGRENDAYLLNVGKDLYIGTVGGTEHPAKLHLFAENNWENPQITVHTGSQVTFNTSSFTSGYTYEFSGNVKLQDELKVDGSVTASYFVGDGSRLTNLPNGLGGGDIADFTFTSETISNNNIILDANQDVTLQTSNGDIIFDADGGVYIGSSQGDNSIVTTGYINSIIGDTNRINNGTGHSITDNLDNIINSIPGNKLVNGDLEFILDSTGSLNTPLLLPTTFTVYLTEDKYVGPNQGITLNGEPWPLDVSFLVNPNGEVETQIANNLVMFDNPGYSNNDTFEFDYTVHGISGFTFEIGLYDVTQNQAGWTKNLTVTQPPQYPSTIKSLGAIRLESNSNILTFGTDGKTILPNDLTINGNLIIGPVSENVISYVDWVGDIEFDYANSSVFYVTGLTSNNIFNVTGVPETEDKALTMTFVIQQGSTPYSGSGYQINGSTVDIKWVDSQIPTGSANKTEVIGLTALKISSSWIVMGSMSTFG